MINLRKYIAVIIMIALLPLASFARDQQDDPYGNKLLQEVRTTFNQNDEQAFYDAINKYRNYLRGQDDTSAFYLSWKNEVLYDVNHNHFY
jgi:hypothetical protein